MQPRRNFWEIYGLYNIKSLRFDGVYLPAMLQQLPKLAPLLFAVAFGSSLDISAIQTESPEPLDYNSQLSTIGEANAFGNFGEVHKRLGHAWQSLLNQHILRIPVNGWALDG